MITKSPPNIPEASSEVIASTAQIATLNSMLPRGYRFETHENARKLATAVPKGGKRRPVVSFLTPRRPPADPKLCRPPSAKRP